MSYDLDLFVPVPGEDLLTTAARERDRELDPLLSEDAKDRNARIFVALKAVNPSLEEQHFEGGVQLVDLNDQTGITIELNNSGGSLSVPYWHDRDADRVLGLIDRYLKVLHQSAGLRAFDPQSDSIVDLQNGVLSSKAVYGIGVGALSATARTKPWWKFW